MHADVFELVGADGFAEVCEREAAESRRDPRTHPQPGDVLAVGNDVREVFQIIHGSVEYGFPGKAASRWLPVIRWQVWARNADVRKVAT